MGPVHSTMTCPFIKYKYPILSLNCHNKWSFDCLKKISINNELDRTADAAIFDEDCSCDDGEFDWYSIWYINERKWI